MIQNELMKIRNDIRELAKQFGLKYKESLFKVSFVTKRERVILNYLAGCPASPYVKFGKTKGERIRKIDEFLNSNEFSSLVKEQGGCVIAKKDIQSSIKKLKSKKLKEELKFILKRLEFTFFGSTILTKPENFRERKFSKTILFHEWIHVLLNSNGISFQEIKRKYWTLDEGLVTYLQTFYENKKSNISKIIERQLKSKKAKDLFKIYGKNALKWNKILENKNASERRKRTILNFYERIKSHELLKDPYYREKLEICKFFGIREGWKVLDIGCGSGGTSIVCSYLVDENGKVIGIDNDPKLLNEAKKNVRNLRLKNVELKLEDCMDIGFPRNFFNIALLLYTPQYIRQRDFPKILKRIKNWTELLGIADQSVLAKTQEERLYLTYKQIDQKLESLVSNITTRMYSRKRIINILKNSRWKIIKQKEINSRVTIPTKVMIENIKRLRKWNKQVNDKNLKKSIDRRINTLENLINKNVLPKFTDWYCILCKKE